ncbi:hypothetical protein NX059_008753 [Plenodomus lindquistii]|nr:hypothetical protein NX059_008753 [Plenodomus lindquistii]
MKLFNPAPASLKTLQSKPKTILITGGSSGIGLATAAFISTLNPNHNLILLDLQPLKTFEAGLQKFSRIDCIFVNAGIAEHKDQFFTDTLDSDGKLAEPDRRVLNIDMEAAADTTKLAIHYLRKNGSQDAGSIVLTASLAGYLASAGAPLYSAAKHGIVGLMRALK